MTNLNRKYNPVYSLLNPNHPDFIPPLFDKEHPLSDLLKPSRYKIYFGGRGAAKSMAVAEALIRIAYESKTLILCTRQVQNSINDSLHRMLCDTIDRLGMQDYFNITRDTITSHTGSVIIYKGIKFDIASIKSTFGVMICVVEEAQDVSEDSWEVLIPTIRELGSEIWVIFNTGNATDPTYQRFVVDPPPDSIVHKINYDMNPYFPDTLRAEMEYMKQNDYEKYLHIWLGQPLKISNAVIFKDRFVVEDFESSYTNTYYHGLDLGYANDPTALIRCFIKDQDLYIDKELGGVGIDTDDLVELIKTVDTARYSKILADNSRPETIGYLVKKGLYVVGAKKGAGSIADGITFLKSFRKIHIHSSCTEVIKEFNNYSWKVDRLTGNIIPIPVDKYNDFIDSLRYAISEVIRGGGDMSTWSKLGS